MLFIYGNLFLCVKPKYKDKNLCFSDTLSLSFSVVCMYVCVYVHKCIFTYVSVYVSFNACISYPYSFSLPLLYNPERNIS